MSAYLGDKLVSLAVQVDYNTKDATAGVGDVLQGEVFYNAEGRQVGTHVCPTVDELLPALSNPATAEQILSGYQAIDGAGAIITGAMVEKDMSIRYVDNGGTGNGSAFKTEQLNINKHYYLVSVFTTDKNDDKTCFRLAEIKDNVYEQLLVQGSSGTVNERNKLTYDSSTGVLTMYGGYSSSLYQRVYIIEL